MNAKHYDTLLGVYGGSDIIDAYENLEKENKLLKDSLLNITEDLNDVVVCIKECNPDDWRKVVKALEELSSLNMEYVKNLLGNMEER